MISSFFAFTHMLDDYGLLWLFILIILLILIGYLTWDYLRWKSIEKLNVNVGITRKNSYIDMNGYLRWRENDRLCHRDIAWNNNIRGRGKFGECDVHHKDENKLNNNPENLEVLKREEHQIKHQQLIFINGQKYRKLAHVNKVYRETHRAYMIANCWFPKSQTIIRNDILYIPEWLYDEKGFS